MAITIKTLWAEFPLALTLLIAALTKLYLNTNNDNDDDGDDDDDN